jgi:hypothetical protein
MADRQQPKIPFSLMTRAYFFYRTQLHFGYKSEQYTAMYQHGRFNYNPFFVTGLIYEINMKILQSGSVAGLTVMGGYFEIESLALSLFQTSLPLLLLYPGL